MCTPVYHEDVHVGWASMFGHMTDVGGMVACSMPNQATEVFQEGLSTPPVKLYSKGVLNEDLLELVLHQVRKPEWNHCDLKALIASIDGLRPIDAGGLHNASALEALTPLLIALNSRYKTRTGIRIVGIED